MNNKAFRQRFTVGVFTAIALLFGTVGAALLPTASFPIPTVNAAPLAKTPTSTDVMLPPPAHPLLAWNVAPDGTVYVLDAFLTVYALAPHTLTPLARSARLRPTVSAATAALTVDEEQVYLSGAALGETVVLRRADLKVIQTLPVALQKEAELHYSAAMLAVDPGRHLFLIGEGGRTRLLGSSRNAVWAYDLTDLKQAPVMLLPAALGEGVGYAEPWGLRVDPTGRRLFVTVFNAPGSSPRNYQNVHLFDLDSLAPLGVLTLSDNNYRDTTLPALAPQADRVAIASSAANGTESLQLFTNDQLPLRAGEFAPLLTAPVSSAQVVIDPAAQWLYLLYNQGVWVLRGDDLSLAAIYPIVTTPPTDLLLAPDGETLYLFGNGWQQALATAELQTMGMVAVAPFPDAWLPDPSSYGRVFPSPQVEQDGTVLRPGGGYIYRSLDGGQSWRPLIDYTSDHGPGDAYLMASNAKSFSLSPTFAEDQTLLALGYPLLRSTDAGVTWQPWSPRLAFTSDRSGNRDLFTADTGGADIRPLTVHPASDETPAWSPAWTYLAFASNRNGNWDIYSIRADCTPKTIADEVACDLRQLTDDPADDLLPAWSPDGRMIAFVSLRDGNPEIYLMESDGGNAQRVTHDPHGDWRPLWFPNGKEIIFTSDRNGSNDILSQRVRQYNTLALLPPDSFLVDNTSSLVKGPADERDAAITPDGRLLYWSNGEMPDGGGRIAALRRAYNGPLETVFYTMTDGLAGHPGGLPDPYDTRNTLVSVERNGDVDIYRLSEQDAVPLITGPGFDGHPAGTPVWWEPTFAGW